MEYLKKVKRVRHKGTSLARYWRISTCTMLTLWYKFVVKNKAIVWENEIFEFGEKIVWYT